VGEEVKERRGKREGKLEDVNWVKARAACSLPRIFEALTERLQRDVDNANELNRSGVRFRLNIQRRDLVIVARQRDLAGIPEAETVAFDLAPQEIRVRQVDMVGKEKPLFAARPVLTEEGNCRLELSGDPQPKDLWQVSRRALQDLFFGFE
jgi:hypothetical protein